MVKPFGAEWMEAIGAARKHAMGIMMIWRVMGILLVTLGLTAGGVGAQVIAPTAPPTTSPVVRPKLGEIRSWGYQLQRIDPERVARSPYDLMVVDYSRDGKETGRMTAADVQRMQVRPDGGRRVVLAYLSIGEAEDYRYYWNEDWIEAVIVLNDDGGVVRTPRGASPAAAIKPASAQFKAIRLPKLGAPVWLGRENDTWATNFFVRYWEPGWQNLVFGNAESYLARLLAAGFDGVYLDRIDAFQALGPERPTARQDMVRFVVTLAEWARRIRPGFLIVPQNGEQLLSDPAYLAAVDAVAKEDLLYGDPDDGQRNSLDTVSRSIRWLAPAVNRGLPVLTVEYLRDQALVAAARSDMLGRGFVPNFAVRALDRLVLPEDLLITPPPLESRPTVPSLPAAASSQGKSAPAATRRKPERGPQTPRSPGKGAAP